MYASKLDDPSSVLEDSWPGTRSGGTFLWEVENRAEPERGRDLVVRGEGPLPPRPALATAGHLGEQAQALVLPFLDRVEITRIVVDQRLDEGAAVADVAGRVAGARAPGGWREGAPPRPPPRPRHPGRAGRRGG